MMQAPTIFRILGLLLMILSLTSLPPLLIELWFKDGHALTFQLSFAVTFGVGFLLWFPFRNYKHPLRTHDGFLIVVLFWLSACFVGTLPLYWSHFPSLSFTDAFFETVSGITTTGSTILTHIDNLPRSILFYRQQLQFVGGISIILLAVAILPTLGIGGMQLFRTEITGPVKDDKLTPRITHTAKAIWIIYVAMTIICALCYYFGGMSWFDAICHSFGTVSTGGFSTHDTSLDYFADPTIIAIAVFFMFFGAVSFNLHFIAFRNKSLRAYFKDPEFVFFVKLIFIISVLVWTTFLISADHKQTPLDTLFHVISFFSTTGYATTESSFPVFISVILLFCGLVWGCACSTSGGLKIVRVLLLQKQGAREITRLIHPHGQYVVKLGSMPISARVIEAIWGFFAIYIAVFGLLLILLLVVEKDFFSVFSALVANLSNTGPGLGTVTTNYAHFSNYAKWILSFAMLAGRLEVFTLLVLFSPAFWRR